GGGGGGGVGGGGEVGEGDGVEAVRGGVREGRRRERQRVVPLPFEGKTAELLAGERGHPEHLAGVRRILAGGGDGPPVDPRSAEDLQGARVDDVRRRRGLRRGAPLYDAARNAEPRQEERGRHAGRASTDHENRGVDSFHLERRAP